MENHSTDLEHLFRNAIGAAAPERCLAGRWPPLPPGRLAVIAVGKAAAPMAFTAAKHYGNDVGGLVLAPEGHLPAVPLPPSLTVMTGSHPVPDARSVNCADAALQLAGELGPDDLLLVLLSGGGSSVMCRPQPGLTLVQKQDLSNRLLASGGTIAEINTVRKRLSAIKGGGLLAASGAPVVTLAISDVPGNEPELIASGPTMEDHAPPDAALGVLTRLGIDPGPEVMTLLREPASTPSSRRYSGQDCYTIIASGRTMLEEADRDLSDRGFRVLNLGETVQGDARELACEHARMAGSLARKGGLHCILSGGETSVRIEGTAGIGGRNTEYLLALTIALQGIKGTRAIAADSDGIDGNGAHAGAVIGPDTLARASSLSLDPAKFLATHDSATFFARLDDLVTTGPTRTNVNDFRAILIAG